MQHRIIACLFYAVYLLAMIKPLLPVMEYYANYDYIANVLCENRDKPVLGCNGKCYLQKQIAANNPTQSNNETIPLINLNDYPIAPLDWFSYELKSSFLDCEANYTHKCLIPQEHSSFILKPPII